MVPLRDAVVRYRAAVDMKNELPESAGSVTGWDMPEGRKCKLLWDNALRFYTRAPA